MTAEQRRAARMAADLQRAIGRPAVWAFTAPGERPAEQRRESGRKDVQR